jgi:hypothetical protein
MNDEVKPLIWLHGEVKTPPLSSEARVETGFLLRKLLGGRYTFTPFFQANAVDRKPMS